MTFHAHEREDDQSGNDPSNELSNEPSAVRHCGTNVRGTLV